MPPENYSVFDLMDDIDRYNTRKRAQAMVATMPEAERYFLLGLLRHEEAAHGQAGIESVIAWIANREHTDDRP